MTKMDDLKQANPVKVEDDWGSTEAGEAQFATVLDMIEDDAIVGPAHAPRRKGWVYALAGFAVTMTIAIPLTFMTGQPESTVGPVVGTVFTSAGTASEILNDNFVTEAELELAAQAVIDCIDERRDIGEGAGWGRDEQTGGITFTISVGESLFEECRSKHFRQIEFVWAAQNDPEPAEGFYFYGAVVQCTEARTGQDFGELGQDTLGFMSTEGNRTINRALEEAEGTYLECFDTVQNQPIHYYFILECVTEATGTDYPSLIDVGHGRLTVRHIEILDGAQADHPREFEMCQRDVALD